MRIRSTTFYRRVVQQACVASDACLHSIGVPRPAVLLVLAHMRSGSTLLLHLLLTNSEIAALGERNAIYTSRADFAHLAIAARMARRSLFSRVRYVADQVNHSHLTPAPALLADSRVRLLFLLRRPEPSINSLLELSRSYYGSSWSVAQAVDYYVTRLEGLMRLAEVIPAAGDAALIRYEHLTESPEETLEALRQYLGLRHGFAPTYNVHPFTGKRGDPGPNITAGRIVRVEPETSDQLSANDLVKARRAYDQCVDALGRFALNNGTSASESSRRR